METLSSNDLWYKTILSSKDVFNADKTGLFCNFHYGKTFAVKSKNCQDGNYPNGN